MLQGTARFGYPSETAYTVGYGGQWGYYADPATRQNNGDSGFILCTHRWYDPINARWLTRDPIGYDGGIDIYSYVDGNPIMGADPSGFGFEPIDELIDGGLVLFDLGAIAYDNYSGASTAQRALDGAALGVDLLGLVPGVPPGGGTAFRLAHGTAIAVHAVSSAMDVSRGTRIVIAGARAAGHVMMASGGGSSGGSVPGANGGNGRGRKQQKLKSIVDDPKASSADRGWVRQEMNAIARGKRTRVRLPIGKVLAHRRGFEARRGFDYMHSDLQDVDLHKLQHKHEGY